eukprot:1685746-Amphidinium_carterae.2
MSWTPRQTELLKKQLMGLGKLLGGKPARRIPQQPNKGQGKGTCRGGGRQISDKSDGWYCKHCEFYNFGYRPVCFRYKEVKAPKKHPPGRRRVHNQLLLWSKTSRSTLQRSKDMPALQQQLQAALLAAQHQKREALPVQDQSPPSWTSQKSRGQDGPTSQVGPTTGGIGHRLCVAGKVPNKSRGLLHGPNG